MLYFHTVENQLWCIHALYHINNKWFKFASSLADKKTLSFYDINMEKYLKKDYTENTGPKLETNCKKSEYTCDRWHPVITEAST